MAMQFSGAGVGKCILISKSSIVIPLLITLGVALLTDIGLAQPKHPAVPDMPIDPGEANLRVSALDTLYEFDLSTEQLKALRAAAVKAGGIPIKTSIKPNAPLAQAMKDFQAALLAGKDDDAISKLRNHVAELASDLDLDDEVQPTEAAMAEAPAVCHLLKASQIAAFLALNADEVNDPVELMVSSLDAIREAKSDGGPTAASTVNSLIAETAASASYLVAGSNNARAATLNAQIMAWLKAGSDLSEKDFAAQEAMREAAAKTIVGDLDPILILTHWLDLHLAQLLSNPELPMAIDATLGSHSAAK